MDSELMMVDAEVRMDGNMSMGPCDSVSQRGEVKPVAYRVCVCVNRQMNGMDMTGGMAMYFTFAGHQCSFLFPNLNLDTPAGKGEQTGILLYRTW